MEDFNNMRLYNTYYICKQCIGIILQCTISQISYEREYQINNWQRVKEALFTVRQIDIFLEDVNKLYEVIPTFVRESESPRIDNEIRKNS